MPFDPLLNPGVPVDLDLGGLAVTAFSISGLATYVLVPEFDACFDLGYCPIEATRLRNVFLSHCHLDHCGGARLHHSMRTMTGARPSRFYVPAPSAQPLRDLFAAHDRLDGREPRDYSEAIRPLAPGDEVRLSGRFTVRCFDVEHRIDSLGYTVSETRRKLRPAFAGLPGPAIAEARERGEELYDFHTINAFTYVGDSVIGTLRRHPEIGQSQVLFLECTHLPGTERSVSATWGHTHLEEILELAAERPEIFASPHIVLKHFSTRYDHRDILRVRDLLPPGLRERVTLLVPPRAR